MYKSILTYLVVHLYLVVLLGFNTDQKDLIAEKLTGIRAYNKNLLIQTRELSVRFFQMSILLLAPKGA